MFEEWKIKREIKKRTKPGMDFEEYCNRHDIDFNNNIEQGSTKVVVSAWYWSIRAISMCCCLFAVIFMIVITLYAVPSSGIKYYGIDTIKEELLDYEQFDEEGIPTLINLSKAEQIGVITKAKPNDNEDLLLGYTITDILYGFLQGDELIAFEIVLTIRCYKGFLFLNNEKFENLQYRYNNCSFDIALNGGEAYIAVEHSDYEYFITVKEYENMTAVNKENIELLIKEIF